MQITLKPMTSSAFTDFWEKSLTHHAAELVREEGYSPSDARGVAEAELLDMLPQGQVTAGQFLYSIWTGSEIVGYLWFLTEETQGRIQAFLCDFTIFPSFRRKGYGRKAVEVFLAIAASLGCCECVLFVSDSNKPAKALYHACGYSALRRHNYGYYMIKQFN